MLHRGKKCFAELKILRKKSLIDDRDITPQRRKGGGSWHTKTKAERESHEHETNCTIQLSLEEVLSKLFGAIEPYSFENFVQWFYYQADSDYYMALVEEVLKRAGYCERYSPKTAEYLRTQAERLKQKVDELELRGHEYAIKQRYRNWVYRWPHKGSVKGPRRWVYDWVAKRDGKLYFYRRIRDWYSWGHIGSEPSQGTLKKRKAQYIAYYVPQEYPSAPYEILMPVECYHIEEIIERSITHEEFARDVEEETREENFMGGISYEMMNPLDTLKLISAGSIFGEPMYYREGDNEAPINFNAIYGLGWEYNYNISAWEEEHEQEWDRHFRKMTDEFKMLTASQVMEQVIDKALSFSFEGTLKWAVELREKFLMRLNPQIIIVRAAIHPNRAEFTMRNPGKFQEYAMRVMTRGDDVIHQLEYWLAAFGTKRGIPAILKRTWAKKIGSMDSYSMSKYANSGTGLINTVRICHAKGQLVDTLMRDGRVPMPKGEDTWERLRASRKSWNDILTTIRMPHMALLRNLRGIFKEVKDPEILSAVLELLKAGVKGGKQFPFRYYTAWKIFEDEKSSWLWDAAARFFPYHERVQNALEECINISCANLPELPGRCAFLTDNSGSAWGAHTSEHGSISMAEIGNLSSVIGAMRAEKGIVFPFGDKLRSVHIDRNAGVLEQAKLVNTVGQECGMSTESGLYLFFENAINQGQHWDNIFIYSDMQTGSSRKFGINTGDFKKLGALRNGDRIDINELVKRYREEVNPKMNIVSIQTSGYTNTVMPEYGYRSSILCGWTGKELVFADAVRRLWDDIESCGDWIIEIDPEKVNLCGF